MNLDTLIHAVSGTAAGALSTIVTHPVDSIKTRLQAQDGTSARRIGNMAYSSTVQAFRVIIQKEGVMALYQGMAPALIGGASAWGLYFGGYNYMKTVIPADFAPRNFASATAAGVFGTVVTCPIWLIKTRLQLYVREERQAECFTLRSELRSILQEEGPRGLFKGIGPQLWLVLNPALQLTVYEKCKAWAHAFSGKDPGQKLDDAYLTACVIVSKTAATVITTPLSVIKVRMQDPRNTAASTDVKYRTIWQSAQTIYSREGPRGFFRGAIPSLMRVMPGSLVTFLSYETISHNLKKRLQNSRTS
uniref:Mitochondrial carrier protein n=1 Tax=Eutreptiella gymnastica TaxID=73025 RepID=A0A7S1HYN5_9EUGL|mmetsp:Transcript_115088/g.200305  ORF Transcript_115088/g.200305 Transcript_115088/m.200305 type:complete len:304 (+) Transcript_115088:177-1088(+)